MVGDGYSDNDSPPAWGDSQKKDYPLCLFRVKVVEKTETDEGVSYEGISDLFNGLEYSLEPGEKFWIFRNYPDISY